MSRPRTASLFAHLALALAGCTLTFASFPFLPEIPLVLLLYLALIWTSWRHAGRWTLPTWAANLFGLGITLTAALWVFVRFQHPDFITWMQDIPFIAALVPHLGPVLMVLLLVRLYRPREPGDFWVLQGLGLLEVALACVLASGAVFFALLLLAYLVVGVCALAAHEGHRQVSQSAPVSGDTPGERQGLNGRLRNVGWGWLGFGARWTLAVALLALPVFLLTPRIEGPEWEPFGRFGPTGKPTTAHMGFSDDIDLTRTGVLEGDDTVAFTVTVTDLSGRPIDALSDDSRWRGAVLDRYEDGHWRSELSWPGGTAIVHPSRRTANEGPDALLLEYKVSSKAGGLFLADPVRLGPEPGVLPVWLGSGAPFQGRPASRQSPLFYEAGGTVVPFSYLTGKEYHYIQVIPRSTDPQRYPARRLKEVYLAKLIRARPADLETWTRQQLLRLAVGARRAPLRKVLQERDAASEALPPVYWEDVAGLLQGYLARSGEYSYSLQQRRDDTGMDPVMDFLVNVREGACERYASALALMLRSQGIPARVIKGYRGAEWTGAGSYQVRQSQAHAWVEAMVPAQGDGPLAFEWLLLDPTPDTDARARMSALSRWRQLQQSGQALWQELIVGYTAAQQANLWEDLMSGRLVLVVGPWLLGGGVLLGLLWLLRRFARRRRARTSRGSPAGLYGRLVEVLALLHLKPRLDETPRELAARAAEVLQRRPALAGLVAVPARVVELFYEARYSPRPPPREELEQAAGEVSALETALRSS